MSNFAWHPSRSHVAFNRYFLLDKNLSLEEKGFLAFFMAVSDDWKFTKKFISEYFDISTAKISKIIDGLVKKEYILLKKEDKDDYYYFLDVPEKMLNGRIINYTTNIEQLQKLILPERKSNKKVKVKVKVKEYDTDSEEYKLACFLYSRILQEDPAKKEPNLHVWAKTFNAMRYAGGVSSTQIQEVICWCFNNKYWKTAISSPDRLRWSWGTIRGQMNKSKNWDEDKNRGINTEREVDNWLKS